MLINIFSSNLTIIIMKRKASPSRGFSPKQQAPSSSASPSTAPYVLHVLNSNIVTPVTSPVNGVPIPLGSPSSFKQNQDGAVSSAPVTPFTPPSIPKTPEVLHKTPEGLRTHKSPQGLMPDDSPNVQNPATIREFRHLIEQTRRHLGFYRPVFNMKITLPNGTSQGRKVRNFEMELDGFLCFAKGNGVIETRVIENKTFSPQNRQGSYSLEGHNGLTGSFSDDPELGISINEKEIKAWARENAVHKISRHMEFCDVLRDGVYTKNLFSKTLDEIVALDDEYNRLNREYENLMFKRRSGTFDSNDGKRIGQINKERNNKLKFDALIFLNELEIVDLIEGRLSCVDKFKIIQCFLNDDIFYQFRFAAEAMNRQLLINICNDEIAIACPSFNLNLISYNSGAFAARECCQALLLADTASPAAAAAAAAASPTAPSSCTSCNSDLPEEQSPSEQRTGEWVAKRIKFQSRLLRAASLPGFNEPARELFPAAAAAVNPSPN